MNKQQKTILLIDDDVDLVTAFERRLKTEFDVKTVVAHNALTALSHLQSKPDLVICDVMMPTANGLGILEMMDQDPQWKDIPVTVLTGCSDGNTLRRTAELSAYYIHKGSDVWTNLRGIVVEVLGVDPKTKATPADELEVAFS